MVYTGATITVDCAAEKAKFSHLIYDLAMEDFATEGFPNPLASICPDNNCARCFGSSALLQSARFQGGGVFPVELRFGAFAKIELSKTGRTDMDLPELLNELRRCAEIYTVKQ